MEIELTKEIREAIRQASDKCESQAELARKTNLHKTYISKYISGEITKINRLNLYRLKNEISPYLPDGYLDKMLKADIEADQLQLKNEVEFYARMITHMIELGHLKPKDIRPNVLRDLAKAILESPSGDCQELCKGLESFDLDMLLKYKDLNVPEKKQVIKLVDDFAEALEKKSRHPVSPVAKKAGGF